MAHKSAGAGQVCKLLLELVICEGGEMAMVLQWVQALKQRTEALTTLTQSVDMA